MRYALVVLGTLLSVACGTGTSTSRSPVQACTLPGDCTGVLPAICQVCDDGTTGCAHFACVNGACEVELCPPRQPCLTAADCTGPLPLIACWECTPGTTSVICPHWECRDGFCFGELLQPCP